MISAMLYSLRNRNAYEFISRTTDLNKAITLNGCGGLTNQTWLSDCQYMIFSFSVVCELMTFMQRSTTLYFKVSLLHILHVLTVITIHDA